MRDRATMAILVLVVVVLAVLAWWKGGPQMALDGLVVGARVLLNAVPLLLAAFLIAGLVQVLVTREMVSHWLGSQSGWRGIALACIGGAIIPGGPYVYFPIAAALLQTGAGVGVLVSFVAAKNLWSLTRIPVEVALLGTRLTLIRQVVTFILPPLLGFLAELLFGGQAERMREEVSS